MPRRFVVLALVLAAGVARADDAGAPPSGLAPKAAAAAAAALAAAGAVLGPAVWSHVAGPTHGPPRAIGGYSAGCIEGAVALPLSGPGFRVARPERHRVFGHPLLIALVRELGRRMQALHLLPVDVGDLGQARGGPAPSGHASHQTGLDVDVWFSPPVHGRALSMVDAAHQRPAKAFGARMVALLEAAAADPHVERIFVNPILKRALCERPGDHGWLRKLRPWWGHDDHFHVRLACPPDSPECVAQAPLPSGDGCSALKWWFDAKAQAERHKEHASYSAKVGAAPALPEHCRAVVDEP